MIHFAWPWLWLALPLPLLAWRWLGPGQLPQSAALRVPELEDFALPDALVRSGRGRNWLLWLAVLAWCLLVAASARPEWLGAARELPLSGRDLMLAVDLSGSMKVEDFMVRDRTVDRLTATKSVADRFIERRKGDRIGLILFGDQAYLQSPLTFDRNTVRQLLDESAIGLAGQYTAIGDAIGLGVKRLRERDARSRILILMTDGANTAGAIEPQRAAVIAAKEGITIYTIGIGADQMQVRDFFGSRVVNPSAQLDEKTLTAIAAQTGGRYFRARDTEELEGIYALLDELEPIEQELQSFRPRSSLFYWPLSLALVLAVILILAVARGRL